MASLAREGHDLYERVAKLDYSKPSLKRAFHFQTLEARAGVEPAYTALQAGFINLRSCAYIINGPINPPRYLAALLASLTRLPTTERPVHATKVLIIEDDPAIARNLYDYLESRGFHVDHAVTGPAGLQLATAQTWDAILLDLNLPGLDGLTLCATLRKTACRDTPVLMLTARDTLDDKLEGFEHGADDYLVKPFSLKEVGARLDALIKRYRGTVAARELRFADVRLDLETLDVERAGRKIKLPPKCLHLLRILMLAPDKVFTRMELEHELWGETLEGSDTLRTHIYTLRKALTRAGEPEFISTLHGLGYRLSTGQDHAA